MTFALAPGNGIGFRHGSGPRGGPLQFSDLDYYAVFQEEFFVADPGGTGAGGVEQDVNYTTITGPATDNRYRVTLVQTAGDVDELLDVGVSSIGGGSYSAGLWIFPPGQQGTLQVNHPLVPLEFRAQFYRQVNDPVRVLDSYVTGSLAKLLSDALWTRAADQDASHLPIFTDLSNPYVRNPNCWVADLDFTGVSPWNSTGGARRAGVAISPLHVLFAWHYQVAVGATIHFVTSDNQLIVRTITAKADIPGGLNFDTTIARLNEPLPESIKWYRFMPADVLDYLPTVARYQNIPAVGFDQQEKALLKNWIGLGSSSNGEVSLFKAGDFNPLLNENIITGDSGNPIFAIVGSEPVLISLWTIPNSGPGFQGFLPAIGTAMTTLGGGYSPQTIDLSAFTNYGD